MGIYDQYGKAQIKVGDCNMNYYKIGDEVDIPDGVYVDFSGVTVVHDGVFVAQYNHLISKWGEVISTKDVIENLHPITSHITKFLDEKENDMDNE